MPAPAALAKATCARFPSQGWKLALPTSSGRRSPSRATRTASSTLCGIECSRTKSEPVPRGISASSTLLRFLPRPFTISFSDPSPPTSTSLRAPALTAAAASSASSPGCSEMNASPTRPALAAWCAISGQRLAVEPPAEAGLTRKTVSLMAGSSVVRDLLWQDREVAKLRTPPPDQVLAFCAENPVERVFLEDLARRGLGRFLALPQDGSIQALCHFGMNIGPAGVGCEEFARRALTSDARMIVGAESAVNELWDGIAGHRPPPRRDRPGEPVRS